MEVEIFTVSVEIRAATAAVETSGTVEPAIKSFSGRSSSYISRLASNSEESVAVLLKAESNSCSVLFLV